MRRSLIAWGSFAILLFILAAIITWIVVGVKHAPIDDDHTMRVEFLFPTADLRPAGASLLSTSYDQPRLTKLGTYTAAEYREERGKATLIIWYPPGVAGKILISHLAGADACQEVLSSLLPTETLAVAPIPASDTSFSDDWILTVTPLRPHNPLIYDSSTQTWSMAHSEYQVHMRCDLRRPADRETFVTKRLAVVARNATGLGTYMGGPTYVAVPMLYV
ncbi:MAG: hypothetical protein JO233_07395, partial [Candidatus Eremiobacteraeota bacterium]|nr:hypothetical protein [Candidatus Eremiobacteraeota bacterium]